MPAASAQTLGFQLLAQCPQAEKAKKAEVEAFQRQAARTLENIERSRRVSNVFRRAALSCCEHTRSSELGSYTMTKLCAFVPLCFTVTRLTLSVSSALVTLFDH